MFEHLDAYTGMLKDMMTKTAGSSWLGGAGPGQRRSRAAGRLLGDRAAPWDMAAGCLMITEAGGLVGTSRATRLCKAGIWLPAAEDIRAAVASAAHLTPAAGPSVLSH